MFVLFKKRFLVISENNLEYEKIAYCIASRKKTFCHLTLVLRSKVSVSLACFTGLFSSVLLLIGASVQTVT